MPTVRAKPSVVPIGARIKLTDMIVTDADPDATIVRYQVRDNSINGGSFMFGDVPLAANLWHEVPAVQVNSLQYRSADAFASETYSVRFENSNGQWTTVGTSLITSGNVSPVITPIDGRVSPLTYVPLRNQFTYEDGDGDTPVRVGFRDHRANSDGGRISVRGETLQQGVWHFFDWAEVGDVLYRGANTGRQFENVSMLLYDGYSFSDEVTFEMATTATPTISPTGLQILTDQSRWAGAFFDYEDQDLDEPVVYNVIDRRTNADGGYFTLNGVRQASGQWFTVFASEFDDLNYVGGSTGPQSEVVGFHIYDGFQWSNVTNIDIDTVVPPEVVATDVSLKRDHYLNVATGGISNTQGQAAPGTPFLEYTDGDNDVIEKFMFIDYQMNANGGHFLLDGVRVPSGQHFTVDTADLDKLEYRAGQFGPQTEDLSVYVYSNGVWSDREDFNIVSLKNEFRPEVDMFSADARLGTINKLNGLFRWSDADDDIPRTFSLFDTGDDPSTGFFTDNGFVLPSRQWNTFDWDKINDIQYHFSDVASNENVRMVISDGRSTSTVATATMRSIPNPELEATANSVSIDTIDRIPVSDLISQTDSGPLFTQYEIYDEFANFDNDNRDRSGRFELDGVDLQFGVMHRLTADQFDRLVFKGAEADFGRVLDPVLIRATNGQVDSDAVPLFTEWERINVNTDPVGADSLFSGARWFGAVPGETVEITFTFIDGDNGGAAGAYPPMPTYYVCAPLEEPDDECNDAAEAFALNQPQRETIREVLYSYERVANIKFREVSFLPDAGDAVMTFGAADLPGAAAWAYLPSGPVTSGMGTKTGDVWFDTDSGFHPNDNFDVGLGSGFRFTAAHEIGHALGFKHPFELPDALPIFSDFDYNTVMSYTHDNVHNPLGPGYPEQPSTGMLYDYVQLQNLYGANTTWNSNNNHYGNFFSGSYPHFSTNDQQHQTVLYDSGGIDTYNYSSHEADETIDLRQGTWSSINGVRMSLSTAYLTVIENARGGSGDDNIRGNEIANLLFGNEGDDVLRGGGGNDALRGGAGDDTYIWSNGDGRDLILEQGLGGVDRLMIMDPSGAVDSLDDDFGFRKFGNDLRIDLTYNQGSGQGTVLIRDFETAESQIEILQIHDASGNQIGNDIDLLSVYDQASVAYQRFAVTDQENDYGTYKAFAVAPA